MTAEATVHRDGAQVVLTVSGMEQRSSISARLAYGVTLLVDVDDLATPVGCSIDLDQATAANVQWLLGVPATVFVDGGRLVVDLVGAHEARALAARVAVIEAFKHPRFRRGTILGLWYAEQVVLLDQLSQLGLDSGAYLDELALASISPLLRRAASTSHGGRAAEAVRAVVRHLPDGAHGKRQLEELLEDLPEVTTLDLWFEFTDGRWVSSDSGNFVAEFEDEFLSGGETFLGGEPMRWEVLWPFSDGLDYRLIPSELTTRAIAKTTLDVAVLLDPQVKLYAPICARVVTEAGAVRAFGTLFRSESGLEGTIYLDAPLEPNERVELTAEPYAMVLSAAERNRLLKVGRVLAEYRDASVAQHSTDPGASGPDPELGFLADLLASVRRHQASSE